MLPFSVFWRVFEEFYRYIPNALSLKASTITYFAQTLIVNHSMHLLLLESEDSLLSRNIALQTEMPNAFSSFINATELSYYVVINKQKLLLARKSKTWVNDSLPARIEIPKWSYQVAGPPCLLRCQSRGLFFMYHQSFLSATSRSRDIIKLDRQWW